MKTLARIGIFALAQLTATSAALAAQSTLAWDKTFLRNAKVDHQKVNFYNRLGINLVGDLYIPKNVDRSRRHATLIVGHPYGGVKEQTSGLYAQTMAERGFITLAFDASYNGESGGQPHFIASHEAFVEDFSAAVDYLGKNPVVDRDRIGIIGICGSGGFSLAAAQIDPRIKAVATVSMYDIGQATRQGLSGTFDKGALRARLGDVAAQRWAEVDGGARAMAIGTPESITEESSDIDKEFFDYYRTRRGHHPRSTTAMAVTGAAPMTLFSAFEHLDWISPRPVLFITGENAHSRIFSEHAFARATEPKELHVVPGAGHVDLYDRVNLIPWDKLTSFFTQYLAINTSSSAELGGAPWLGSPHALDSIHAVPERRMTMEIMRAGSRPSGKGPADWFTGTVRIDPLFTAPAPARAAGAAVTFEPGARTAWHTHPLGQTLIVLTGLGLVQREGSVIEEIRPGDVVWIPPNERHWHGASPTTAMTHIAVQEQLDGKAVEWLEKVTDDQYGAGR